MRAYFPLTVDQFYLFVIFCFCIFFRIWAVFAFMRYPPPFRKFSCWFLRFFLREGVKNQNGFFTAEYLETEWYNTGIYDEPTGNEFIIKQKIWIVLDSNQISVESIFGYMDNEEMVVFDSAPDELYRVVNALPEGLKQMVLSKAL